MNYVIIIAGFFAGIFFGTKHKAQKELQMKGDPEKWAEEKPKANMVAVGIFFAWWFGASIVMFVGG
jgi:hypothetical protein